MSLARASRLQENMRKSRCRTSEESTMIERMEEFTNSRYNADHSDKLGQLVGFGGMKGEE